MLIGDDLIHDEVNDNITDEQINVIEKQISLLDGLKSWALHNKIPVKAVSELLGILRAHGKSELPKDGRTLLETPLSIDIAEMGSGKFWYNGIEENLQRVLTNKQSGIPQEVSLIFNIDGFSPFNSSNWQFWPITFIIDESREIPPLVAAIFYGEGKPPLESYFQKFVEELNKVIRTGVKVNNDFVGVKIKFFVCDTQARSFIKGTPGCNAENSSCIKCTVTGEWDHKGRHMSYPKINCPRRTDESFRNETDTDHHKQHTPLKELPIDMVEDFIVADSLHLLDLGIMRRCLHGWREGNYNFKTKLSKQQSDSISKMLEQCNQNRPLEIQRAIRGLKTLKFWKGSEYRIFLIYLGAVVLKDHLDSTVYEHFLTLSCAVIILSCKEYMRYIDTAKILIENYIKGFIKIYGADSISSNVHNLCHVIDDVKKFGPLPSISSYPFENYLGYLKSLVRHGNLPLSQMAKRIIELSKLNCVTLSENRGFLKKRVNQECHQLPECNGVYKEVYVEKDFILKSDEKNCFFLTKNNEIAIMINATNFGKEVAIYGKKINRKYDFFTKPLASSQLNIFAAKVTRRKTNESKVTLLLDTDSPKLYSLHDMKCKLFCIHYHDECVFMPLLHTLESLT
nr:unnamed protein product [Callosobruchus chinensis]